MVDFAVGSWVRELSSILFTRRFKGYSLKRTWNLDELSHLNSISFSYIDIRQESNRGKCTVWLILVGFFFPCCEWLYLFLLQDFPAAEKRGKKKKKRGAEKGGGSRKKKSRRLVWVSLLIHTNTQTKREREREKHQKYSGENLLDSIKLNSILIIVGAGRLGPARREAVTCVRDWQWNRVTTAAGWRASSCTSTLKSCQSHFP